MDETKNEPTPKWTADPDGTVWDEGENFIAEIKSGDGRRDGELAAMLAAAPETERQRDELLVMLRRMLKFTGLAVVHDEARALIAKCESGDAGGAP